eukprot:1542994-Pyramimonas_sp.AAC.1
MTQFLRRVLRSPSQEGREHIPGVRTEDRRRSSINVDFSRAPSLGLHTVIKPLVRPLATGEFNFPPNYLRTILTAWTLSP